MTKPVELWIKALRSGEYQQTKSALHDDHGFCCLGVACEVAIKNGIELDCQELSDCDPDGDPHEYESIYTYDGSGGKLPESVVEWLGFSSPQGHFTHSIVVTEPSNTVTVNTLAGLNDHAGWNFNQIAAFIESMPKGLFPQPQED